MPADKASCAARDSARFPCCSWATELAKACTAILCLEKDRQAHERLAREGLRLAAASSLFNSPLYEQQRPNPSYEAPRSSPRYQAEASTAGFESAAATAGYRRRRAFPAILLLLFAGHGLHRVSWAAGTKPGDESEPARKCIASARAAARSSAEPLLSHCSRKSRATSLPGSCRLPFRLHLQDRLAAFPAPLPAAACSDRIPPGPVGRGAGARAAAAIAADPSPRSLLARRHEGSQESPFPRSQQRRSRGWASGSLGQWAARPLRRTNPASRRLRSTAGWQESREWAEVAQPMT